MKSAPVNAFNLPACAQVLAAVVRSLASGRHEVDVVPDTLCNGLGGIWGALNFALLNPHLDVIVVDDTDTVTAQQLLGQVLKQGVERSSALCLLSFSRKNSVLPGAMWA